MSQRWRVILSNLAVVALFSVACASGTNEDFDILIENGRSLMEPATPGSTQPSELPAIPSSR